MLNKRMKTTCGAIIICLLFTGCSSSGSDNNATSIENKTTQVSITNDVELKEIDRKTLNTYYDIVINFITETSTKISEQLETNGTLGARLYCNSLTKPEEVELLNNNVDTMYSNVQTKEGQKLFSEIREVFDEYFDIITQVSQGNLNMNELQDKMYNMLVKNENVRNKILDF